MSWSAASVGIAVRSGGGVRYLPITSTSTVLLSDFVRDVYHLLRMFLNCDADFGRGDEPETSVAVAVIESVDEDVTVVGLTKAAGPWSYIKYIDSDTTGNFEVDEDSGDYQVYQTWIAQTYRFTDWTIPLTTGDTLTGVGGEVLYTDPSVLAVPDEYGGGYLMLLGRRRHQLTDSSLFNAVDSATLISEQRRFAIIHL